MYSQDLEPALFKKMKSSSIKFLDLKPSVNNLLADLLEGFSKDQKSIPPKYFYDTKGSLLFDLITELDEYYPARTEIKMLYNFVDEILAKVGSGKVLIEPGSGSCTKAQILLNKLKPSIYIPMDISGEHLLGAAKKVKEKFPWLKVHAVCTDCTKEMRLPEKFLEISKLAFFPGSTIGNFDKPDAINFLKMIVDLLGENGKLLIGVDLKKDKDILISAYDDKQGVTALFNLNLLKRINNELKANFNLNNWKHKAIYNENIGRIEMHLVSSCEQKVTIDNNVFNFFEGESIHTENSYKYTIEEFQEMGVKAGFEVDSVWVDENELFSIHLLKVRV